MEQEKSIFLQTFGDTPILRVLDFLVTHRRYDYSMTDIAVNAGIGYTTLKSFWKELINKSIIKQTRTVGKAKMYQLDRNNPAVNLFLQLYNKVVERETEKIIGKKLLLTKSH